MNLYTAVINASLIYMLLFMFLIFFGNISYNTTKLLVIPLGILVLTSVVIMNFYKEKLFD